MIIESTLKTKLIYIFGIDDKAHEGCLKIGEATLDEDADLFQLQPNCDALNNAAHKRIKTYTQTAGIEYHLLHTELAIFTKNKQFAGFNDKQVHDVLIKSGIKRKDFNLDGGKASEWFEVDLQTAKAAIFAVKTGKSALDGHQITSGQTPISLRKEQRDAIDLTKVRFEVSDQVLWNAKMRFGKTLTALQLFKELSMSDNCYKRMLILTHRPVVNDGWFEDFGKIFFETDSPYHYGSKQAGNDFTALESILQKDKTQKYVYFASMQDLRGSSIVGGKFEKNDELFSAHWDLLVIDEAHEGTQTELGDKVIKALVKKGTKTLHLSGTPFSLFSKFSQDDIYTWSYVDEQEAKAKWAEEHEGDSNPYGTLPRMNMFTYDLGENFSKFQDGEYSFNFHEFFRVDDHGEFVYRQSVLDFLNLMCEPSGDNNYPFSTPKYRDYFRHTFWLIPGVKEGIALQRLLKEHPVFCNFNIANVAGDGDPEDPSGEALAEVRKQITDCPEDAYSITLSCGKLTTGVTVKEWTAVLMLSGSAKTGAASYMQTIFRVQSPGKIGGRQKDEAYVFDFAPDRVLTMMAQAVKTPTRPGQATQEHREKLKKLLNFFPVIALKGSETRRYDVDQLLTRLKHVYIERVVNSGFDNDDLYDRVQLLKLTDLEIQEFQGLKGIIGSTPAQQTGNDIVVNEQGLDGEDTDNGEKKPKPPLTPEEQERKRQERLRKEQRKDAISILRGISIRMPMLIYGCDLKEGEDITIENFADHIDPRSWEEFMPLGISKQIFNNFKKYYDPEIFLEAGRQIRERARRADSMRTVERIRQIIDIFATFRNPDKETVLTPWRVVNMQLSDTLGGYDFFEETHTEMLNEPRFVDRGSVTNRVFMGQDTKILELNSKSGLYPLYMAYSIWRERCREWERQGFFDIDSMTIEEEQLAWDDVLSNNIFVVCKTPMAVSITKRTLAGFRTVKQINARYQEGLVDLLKDNPDQFTKDVVRGQYYWHNKSVEKEMKFNAIVGNPPYQINVGSTKDNYGMLIFQDFVQSAKKLDPDYISMIFLSRWITGGRGLDDFRKDMLNDDRLRKIVDFVDSNDCFPSVDIAGGINYILWDRKYHGLCDFVSIHNGKISKMMRKLNEFEIFTRHNEALSLIKKVSNLNNLSKNVSSQTPFGFVSTFRGEKKPFDGSIPIFTSGGVTYVARSDVKKNSQWIDKWKLIFSKATCEHAGVPDKTGKYRVFSSMHLLKPGEICTQSYLVGGVFDSEEETNNYWGYLKTKFVRILILITLSSQDIGPDKFQFVPMQDFSRPWTDADLYAKYGITEEEQAYIESLIKPME